VAVDTAPRTGRHRPLDRTGSQSVYVWELPLRIVHWTIVLSIIVLTVTGLWLYSPFFSPPAQFGPGHPGFTLGVIRFIHELTGGIFIAALFGRLYWAHAGNRYASWRALLPLTTRQRWRLSETVKYYAFRRRDPPPSVGHNPLAGLAYVGLYGGFALSAFTGLALFAWLAPTSPFRGLLSWTWTVMPIQNIRMIHFLLMFWFLAFAVHHIYSAVPIDLEERNGELSSMITGWKIDTSGEDDF
jgi:Ni/Fe-hydrogenase 1 B-type cytochrome subunit